VVLEQGFSCRFWPKTVKQRTDLNHSLLTRSFKNLWVITGSSDLELFKTVLPTLLPMGPGIRPKPSVNILFLHEGEKPDYSPEEKAEFLRSTRKLLTRHGFGDGTFAGSLERPAAVDREEEVCREAARHNYGVVLIGRNHHEPWRQRIFYKLRHKVIGLIGPNAHPHDVLVPLDLSDASLLILKFLQQTWLKSPEAKLHFIHVLTGRESDARKRWAELKKMAAIESNLILKLLEPRRHVAADISEEIRRGGYGAIVMGKRGLSGIKRILLGSVSSGVLSRLEDQSLFLVD
jgi:2,4-dienoyl-CoA reductase (NADPH2)